MQEYSFVSERMGFREWRDKDATLMLELNKDPRVMKYFPSTQDLDQTKAFIKRMQGSQRDKGYCYFAVEMLKNQEFIGFIGLLWQDLESPYTPCVDIGWRLKPSYWGKGLATEGARRSLKYAFEELKLSEVRSVAPLSNKPSINVMIKIGMRELGRFIYEPFKENIELRELVFYSMLKEDFE